MNDSDRRRIADLSRWAHDSGWTDAGWRGFQNATYEDQATVAVRANEAGFQVWLKSSDAPHFTGQPTEYPAGGVQQALNILTAIGILPPSFSESYWRGVKEAGANPATPAATPAQVPSGLEFALRELTATVENVDPIGAWDAYEDCSDQELNIHTQLDRVRKLIAEIAGANGIALDGAK